MAGTGRTAPWISSAPPRAQRRRHRATLSTVPTNGGSAFLEGNSETLTNTNNVIQGTGIIGNGSLALINQHVIDTTPEGGTSTLTLNGLVRDLPDAPRHGNHAAACW